MAKNSESAPINRDPSLETEGLLERVRAGHRSALDVLFERQLGALRRWARGRLPRWARRASETADLVQDALLRTLGHLDQFQGRGKGALEAYLRQAVQNRIRDELRSVARRPTTEVEDLDVADRKPSPLDNAISEDERRLYRQALERLRETDRELIVGALELGYTHAQLALVSGRSSANSARVALHRALRRLADEMTRV